MLPTDYQELVYKRTYARWLDTEGRREDWDESINRYRDYFIDRLPEVLHDEFAEAMYAFRNHEVVGAMRSLWTAGKALDVDNIAGFNCAYSPLAHPKDFAEMLYILMNGAGIGVSVERQYVNKLRPVPQLDKPRSEVIVFADSKRGWAEGFYKYLCRLWNGMLPYYDLSKIRPKGARLKTFGGRASGPEPLKDLLEFVTRIFLGAQGRRLTSEECADIGCKIAECVVVGGVRRSAILILTNPSDRRMANFKTGEFWLRNPHRALANISACYEDTPDAVTFTEDFLDLMKSGTGERGIVNRGALKNMLPVHRNPNYEFGVNPCGEVILRPKQFCNLTEIVLRPGMGRDEAHRRMKHAVLLGIVQSTMTNFQFIGKEWQRNTEEERLLGVSLTGVMDAPEFIDQKTLSALRGSAHIWAEHFAETLDIPVPTAVTCVKPSGTVSQLVDSSSGLHPRFADHYLRRIRIANTDPICQFLIDSGVPWSPEVGETEDNYRTGVFSFPHKAPDGSVVTNNVNAIGQLNTWKQLKKFYTDHNPSVTIHVKETEWVQVMNWVYTNWDILGGIALLPYGGGHYSLMPYEEITAHEYAEATCDFPNIDWEKLNEYESTDKTTGSQEYACVGGGCEL